MLHYSREFLASVKKKSLKIKQKTIHKKMNLCSQKKCPKIQFFLCQPSWVQCQIPQYLHRTSACSLTIPTVMASANNAINFVLFSPSSKQEKWKIIFQFEEFFFSSFFPYSIPLMLPFATIWHEFFFYIFFSYWEIFQFQFIIFFYCCHKEKNWREKNVLLLWKITSCEKMRKIEEWKMKILG